MTDAAAVALRVMRADEFAAYRTAFIAEWAADLERADALSSQAATQRATAGIDGSLPDGPATAGELLLVVTAGDEPVGTVWLSVAEAGRAHLSDITIDAGRRGRGYGRQALALLEAEARHHGARTLDLNVYAHNPRAQRLYERAGFRTTRLGMRRDIGDDPGEREAPAPTPVAGVPARERRALGRAARGTAPRGALAGWETGRSRDPLVPLQAQNAMRRPDLIGLRHARMALSPWTFYRGAAAVMAHDLASRPDTGILVQLCGDAHILNFGLWATPERRLSFDLRDFDETLPGPFEWDVARLAASIVVLARDNGVDAGRADAAVASCLRAYRERLSHYRGERQLDIWYDLIGAQQLVDLFRPEEQEQVAAHIERRARRRTSRGAVAKLTERVAGHLRITDDPPVREHLGADERDLVRELYTAYHDSLQADRRHLLDRFTFVDAVRQVVGVGSVGMRVFLLLLEGRDGADPLFLQIKQAGPSVYEATRGRSPHPSHGERVVAGKRLIQSATDIFVGWTSVGDGDFYVRQFRDMKVVPRGELIAPRLAEFAGACGAVLARAHARTGDPEAITAYVGGGRRFDAAMHTFALAYADQTERDHRRLADAIAAGDVPGAGIDPAR